MFVFKDIKINLNVGDIIINKKPYKGEVPYKILSEPDKNNHVLLAQLDRKSLEFDYDFKESKHVESLIYYEKIDNLNKWIEENKNAIEWRSNVWKLSKLI